jgi:cytidine deaminase
MLDPTHKSRLADAAVLARRQAYAPYSRFQVGAAILTPSLELFAGCNVENASYGLTICAERSALFHAVASGHRRLIAVAVASARGASPCGACRQVLKEFSDDLIILLVDSDDPEKITELTLGELLPHSFKFSGGFPC